MRKSNKTADIIRPEVQGKMDEWLAEVAWLYQEYPQIVIKADKIRSELDKLTRDLHKKGKRI